MHTPVRDHLLKCEQCRSGDPLPFEFTMAFQPIVDVQERQVAAYEALVRGVDGAGAASILDRVTDDNRYRFDQACRTKAIELAARLGIECRLSINFLPNAVYEPAACIRATLAAAERFDFPIERIVFEVTESEDMVDKGHLTTILRDYRDRGFITAIDDFGAGYAGLSLLVDFQPDVVKIDMGLLRGVDADPVRQVIVDGVIDICRNLQIDVVAEGIETYEEYSWFRSKGVRYMQGYLFAKPELEALPSIDWPD
ncbi:EAL domain-containing protein [Demequina muriae]|uniref:EAL domain-containing protein n=1 Tax=Demequina muriae TaxID=3051664 RepID=A0ABT8GGV0_9MICO|nr:EAL domain-containing protein [Demequina sp. EGI L300058]MDN4480660.1 EAL domain-containing protein [Demequina sp. EGI L300058]